MEDTDELVGTTIRKKYVVEKVLGKGGMGKVYLVRNIKLGNKWAMKVIKKDNERIKMYKKEVEILEHLNHPNIPHIVDKFTDKDNLYLIETYAQGVSLLEKIDMEGTLGQDEVLDYFMQLSEILDYLHNNKPIPIIYRDLKPSNIIVTFNNRLMLVDFGISEMNDITTISKSKKIITCSRYYSPPEQLDFNKNTDERSDIYSLGMLMLRLLNTDVTKLKHEDAIANASITQELKDVLEKCTYENPNDRYQKIEDLIIDLKYLKDANYKLNYNGRKVIYVDGNGSFGKTFITSQLGYYFSKNKILTCILDLTNDIGITEYIDVSQDENVNSILNEKKTDKIKKSAYKQNKYLHLFKGEIVKEDDLIDFINKLTKVYRVILIDGNVNISENSKIPRYLDNLLLITSQNEKSITNANKKIIDYLDNDIDLSKVCVVVNRYENSYTSKYEILKGFNIITKLFKQRDSLKNVLTVSNIENKTFLKKSKERKDFFTNDLKLEKEIDFLANYVYNIHFNKISVLDSKNQKNEMVDKIIDEKEKKLKVGIL